jgi:hypothetical protein
MRALRIVSVILALAAIACAPDASVQPTAPGTPKNALEIGFSDAYTLQFLLAFPGNSPTGIAMEITDNNEVAGHQDNPTRSFVWTDLSGNFSEPPATEPGVPPCCEIHIGNDGTVVYETKINGDYQLVLWRGSRLVPLGPDAHVRAVCDDGGAVGADDRGPALWLNTGQRFEIAGPEGPQSGGVFTDINCVGQISATAGVGGTSMPFRWSPAGWERLPLPAGAISGQATKINHAGTVLGLVTFSGIGTRPAIWPVGASAPDTLPLPTGAAAVGGSDIGPGDLVVGDVLGADGVSHAAFWTRGGGWQYLLTIDPDDPSHAPRILPSHAIAVNSSGIIAGGVFARPVVWLPIAVSATR